VVHQSNLPKVMTACLVGIAASMIVTVCPWVE